MILGIFFVSMLTFGVESSCKTPTKNPLENPQVVIRLLCCWVLLSLLIAGPVAWRLYRYNSVLGGTELSTLVAYGEGTNKEAGLEGVVNIWIPCGFSGDCR